MSSGKNKMLFVVDIGNTDITLGVFEGEDMRATWRLTTGIHRLVDEYAALLLNLLRHRGIETTDIENAAMCLSLIHI